MKFTDLELRIPADLNAIWVDRMTIGVRADNIIMMVFETAMADWNMRKATGRFYMTRQHGMNMIDVLAANLDHYPVKQDDAEKPQGRDL